MLIIGLTGGIGSGKTTVTNIFKSYNIPILDADIIARELVEPGKIALEQIVDYFGETILNEQGQINRTKLRDIVFNRPNDRRHLENILHPLIRKQIHASLPLLKSNYCIICMPLLLETKQTDLVNRILVIDVPEDIQLERAKKRDQLTNDEMKTIINVQFSREERLKYADDVILNDNNIEALAQKVQTMHLKYSELAKNKIVTKEKY